MRESPLNASTRGGTDAARGHGGKRVLIVDDSLITARVLTKLLTRTGLECTHAAIGQLAVDAWTREIERGTSFSATLMDKVRTYMCSTQCVVSS